MKYNINHRSQYIFIYQVAADLKNRINNGEWEVMVSSIPVTDWSGQYECQPCLLRQALADWKKMTLLNVPAWKRSVVNDNPKQFIHQLRYSLVSGNYETDSEHPISAEMLELKKIDKNLQICL